MLPGAAGKINEDDIDDKIIDRSMAIITSMTKKERRAPQILNASRRKRIAAGAGVSVSEVNKLVSQYEQSAKLMKQMNAGGFKIPKGFMSQMGKMGGMGGLGGLGGLGGGFGGGLFGHGGNKKNKRHKKKR